MNKIRDILLKDNFILGVILINSLILFIQGFDISYSLNFWLEGLDNICILIFIFEFIAKFQTYGTNYFKSTWNIIDFSLVLVSIPSFIYFVSPLMLPESIVRLDFLLAFRTLRVLRIFRLFKFFQYFKNINKVIDGVKRAIESSVLILLTFVIFNFTISLISCFLFKDISPDHFSNPLVSFYSIFKIFTIEGWYDIPDAISQGLSPILKFFVILYFIVILFVGGIFGLSLVNSIFVDAMVEDNNDELKDKISKLEAKIDFLINQNRDNV